MATVLVTGAAGLIGGQLARRLSEEKHRVIGVSRRKPQAAACAEFVSRSFGASIRDVLEKHAVDVVVHCAHDVSPGGAESSEQGTLQWAEEAEQIGSVRQVFISSVSARDDARSSYGRVKYRLENWFLERGGAVVRPGLVIGNGGLFARMVRLVKKLPVVPVFEAGRTRVYFVGIEFLCDVLANAVRRWPGGVQWSVQQPEAVTMRELLSAIGETLGRRRWLFPIPYTPCLAASWVLDRCKLRGLGISYDNLVGLKQNSDPSMESDFLALGGRPEDIQTLVQRAVAEERNQAGR